MVKKLQLHDHDSDVGVVETELYVAFYFTRVLMCIGKLTVYSSATYTLLQTIPR